MPSAMRFPDCRPLGSWLETGFEEMTQGFGSIAQGLQKAALTIVNLAFQHFNSDSRLT
jgi:hypothetical protein